MLPFRVLLMKRTAGAVGSVNIFDLTADSEATNPSDASAGYQLASTGGGFATDNSPWTWLVAGLSSDYQVRATKVTGSTPTGSLGTWNSLSSTTAWNLTQTIIGSKAAQLFIEIRRTSDSVVIDSATINLSVIVDA